MKRAFALILCVLTVFVTLTACGGVLSDYSAELTERLATYDEYAERLSIAADDDGHTVYRYRTKDDYAIEFTVTAYVKEHDNFFGLDFGPRLVVEDDVRKRVNEYMASQTEPYELYEENLEEVANEILNVCLSTTAVMQKYNVWLAESAAELPLTIVTESGEHTAIFKAHKKADIDTVIGRLYRVLNGTL